MKRALPLAIVASLALAACGGEDEIPLEVTITKATAGGVGGSCPNTQVTLELELENKGDKAVRWSLGGVWVKHRDGHSMTPNEDGSLPVDQFLTYTVGGKDSSTMVAPGAKVTVVSKTGYNVGFASYADKATTWRVSFELVLDGKAWSFEGEDITDTWPHTDCQGGASRYSPCAQASCGNPTGVADEAALKTLIAGLKVAGDGRSTVGCIETSKELKAQNKIVITLPERPAGDPPPCDQIPRRFTIEDTIAGVKCLEVDPKVDLGPSGCRVLEIEAGTVFRVRAMNFDIHPGYCNFSKLIGVMPGCDAPCQNPDLKCSTTRICHSSYDEFCRRCEDRTVEACACRDDKGRLAEGTECDFFYADMGFAGTCQSGTCVTKQN